MELYPKAEWLGNAGRNGDGEGWGPLPDRGGTAAQIRLVVHTTETNNLPGYSGGSTAPHHTYDAVRRRWYQHGRLDRRMGTLSSSSSTGVLGNEISYQIEVVAYSDRQLAAERGGLWAGDFTAQHYSDLADYVRWLRSVTGVPLDRAYGPSVDFPTFIWGPEAATRMTPRAWLAFGGGVTAHGAAANSAQAPRPKYRHAHWDTGAMDLHRIVEESLDPAPVPPVDVEARDWAKVARLAARMQALANKHTT